MAVNFKLTFQQAIIWTQDAFYNSEFCPFNR